MIPTMDETLLRASWSRELDLFFIDRKFNKLRGNVKTAHDLLKEAVGPSQVPSYADIQALTEGTAISLLSVCRLRYCLEEARRARNDLIEFFFVLDKRMPIRPGRVVPSINVFDSDRYRTVTRDLDVQKGELTDPARKAIGMTLNVALFEENLETGYSAGKTGESKGFYRLTDYMTAVVYQFLQSKAAVRGYELQPMNFYFPRNPTHGPGNGK